LKVSKDESAKVLISIEKSVVLEVDINETRNSYREVSGRGSILYFVIADLSGIDPMYQNSLQYVKKLFNEAIAASKKAETHEERIKILLDAVTKNLYTNICRGLFEAHKLIYSFMICTSI